MIGRLHILTLTICACVSVVLSACKPAEGDVERSPVAVNNPSPFEGNLRARTSAAPQVTAWRELRSVAIGERFLCGLSRRGQVYCWGSERYGELGLGPPQESEQTRPRGPLLGMGEINELKVNRGFACGVSAEKRPYCWGNNYYNQLGDGTAQNRATPGLVEMDQDVVGLALGGTHACALTDSATVFCWGDNRANQLGDTLPEKVMEPSLVAGLGSVRAMALGNRSSCFLRRNGSVVCVGSNAFGELGRGVGADTLEIGERPAPVVGLPPLRALEGYANHYCGLTDTNDVYCWGGQVPPTERELRLRNRRIAGNLPVDPLPRLGTPEKMEGLENTEAIAVGLDFSCALRASGQVYCWGDNTYGQLGSGSQSDRSDPSPVAGIHDATDVWVGSRNACVRSSDGRVLCWGNNQGGQLGNGGFATALVPTPVMQPEP